MAPKTKKTEDEEVKETPKGEVLKVYFKIRNHPRGGREFTPAEHGENFLEVANEFEKNNKAEILSRTEE